ncbi:MAG TPA: CHAT domain-containing protein [Longimicrobium sp.]|nr:CHAT domain-containing protein [Longimicrobium sp.]
MSDPIQVLILASDPVGSSVGLRIDHEIRRVIEVTRNGRAVRELKIATALAVSREDLVHALLEHRPHIVHFAGHADGEGIFLDNWDKMLPGQLIELITTFPEVRAVVLNACKGLPVARALSAVVDYTVAMEAAIGDRTAVDFSGAFYAALAFGNTVRFAFKAARASIAPDPDETHPEPQLLERPGAAEWPTQPPSAGEPVVAPAAWVKQEHAVEDVEVGGAAELENDAAVAPGGTDQNIAVRRTKIEGSLSAVNRVKK